MGVSNLPRCAHVPIPERQVVTSTPTKLPSGSDTTESQLKQVHLSGGVCLESSSLSGGDDIRGKPPGGEDALASATEVGCSLATCSTPFKAEK